MVNYDNSLFAPILQKYPTQLLAVFISGPFQNYDSHFKRINFDGTLRLLFCDNFFIEVGQEIYSYHAESWILHRKNVWNMPKHRFDFFCYISFRISNFLTPVFTKNELERSKRIKGLWKFFLAKTSGKGQSTEIYEKIFVIVEKYHSNTTFCSCTVRVTTAFLNGLVSFKILKINVPHLIWPSWI